MSSRAWPSAVKAMKHTAGSFENAIREDIANGVAGTMPFPAFHIYSFSTAGREFMGPWADLLEGKVTSFSRWYMPEAANVRVNVTWPALSGKGVKIDSIMTGTQADNINFFDPTRAELAPNDVYHAMKRGFNPMPPLRQTRYPEVIVTIDPTGAERPVLARRPGDPCLRGVMPDSAGRAWFVLPHAGRYVFSHGDGAKLRSRDFDAVEKPLRQPPGFAYIDKVDLSAR